MAERGDVQTQILFGVGSTAKPVITVPAVQDLEECCYITPVFGNPDYIASPDPLKEGTNSYFNFYDPNAITAVTLNIQKCVGGAFVTQHTIIDDTYGTFKDLGVEIKRGLNYISIKNINWSKVLVDFGAGTYRGRGWVERRNKGRAGFCGEPRNRRNGSLTVFFGTESNGRQVCCRSLF